MVQKNTKKPSFNPAGRPKGSKNKYSASIKEAIEKAFHHVNQKGYLLELAYNEPAVFAGLVKAIIPAEINASLQHNVSLQVNIGEAMALAEKKLSQLEDKGSLEMTLINGGKYEVIEKIEQSPSQSDNVYYDKSNDTK